MAKLFVSYSRRDSAAARKLIEAFRAIEQDVWVDWESIPPAVDWLEQIFRGIEEADAFLFLISPDSIASEVCKVEINRAAQNNKRIIPIVLRDVPAKDAPENIRKLNWTFIREGDNFEEGLAKVKTAIELDLDWLEEHRRLQVRSLEWHRKKDPSLLLRGRDLRNARHMVKTATAKDPIPTDLQQTFIQYSMQSERNRTIAWIATGIAVVAMAILSFLAVRASNEAQVQRGIAEEKAVEANNNAIRAEENRKTAEENRRVAEENALLAQENEQQAVEARDAAEKAENIAEAQRSAARAQIYQSRPGELYTSTLLAIDSMQRDPTDEAEEILRKNVSLLPLPVDQVTQAGNINAIAFRPETNIFVTASADGTVCAWEIQREINNLFCTPTNRPSANALAFAPDGSFFVTGDQSGLVQLLDSETGDVLHAFQRVQASSNTVQIAEVKDGDLPSGLTAMEVPVVSVSLRPPKAQQVAAAFSDGQIPIFDPNTGKISSPLWSGSRPNVAGFSPNGGWLVAGSENGRATVWNLSSNKAFSPATHRGGLLTMAFSPRNNKLATGGNDNTASIISLGVEQELLRIPNQNSVRALAFSPDGSWLVTASDDHRIRIWDALTGNELLGMTQDGIVTELVVSPNGQWIATSSDDRTVRVWDATTGAEIFRIPLHASGSVLAFSNDNNYLISTDQTGAISVWDMSVMAAPTKTLASDGILDNVQYSPSGEQLAVSSENGLWLLTPDPEVVLRENDLGSPDKLFKSKIEKLTFSPDSKYLGVLTERNEVAIFNTENGRLLTVAVSSLIQSIGFSPDSQQFLTSDSEGSVQAWNALDGKLNPDFDGSSYTQVSSFAASTELLAIGGREKISFASIEGLKAPSEVQATGENALLVFSADGSRLASSNTSGQINIWKSQNGAFSDPISFTREQAASLALNPDGTLLAVGTAQNVYLIDTGTGEEIARIPHTDIVSGVSFSADGNYLASASFKVLQFWEISNLRLIKSEELITTACSHLVENFNTSQWTTLFGNEKYRTLCENLPVPQ